MDAFRQTFRQTQRLYLQNQQICWEFVEIELDLAITFCQMTLAADTRGKAHRSMENARRAYISARTFARRIKKNGKPCQDRVDEKIQRLTALFAEIENPSFGSACVFSTASEL